MNRQNLLIVMAGCIACTSLGIAQTTDILKFDDVFPRKRLTGKTASDMTWSFDNRFLAYKWNAIDDIGMDLWIYDSKEKKTTRVTSIESMSKFDRDTM